MRQPSREEAIARLEHGQAALQALFARLSAEEMTRTHTIGTGDWSAKDLLGHMAFWEELALESLAAWRAGRRPPTEGRSAGEWPGTDAVNARNQQQTATQPLDEVRQRAALAHARIFEAIRTMPLEEWEARAFYPQARAGSLGELLGRVLGGSEGPFEHAADHLPDLRAYVDALGT